jgi:hypothetical protein
MLPNDRKTWIRSAAFTPMCCPLISLRPRPVPVRYPFVIYDRLRTGNPMGKAAFSPGPRSSSHLRHVGFRDHIHRLICEVECNSTGAFHKLTLMHPLKSFLRNKELNGSLQSEPYVVGKEGLRGPLTTRRICARSPALTELHSLERSDAIIRCWLLCLVVRFTEE